MNGALLDRTTGPLPTGDHYARNLIGGHWQFPAAPYEFEIRNPADSTISAVVPLSSRFDVAHAYRVAGDAVGGGWSDPLVRMPLLNAVVERLGSAAEDLAQLQSLETGLAPADSRTLVTATLDLAKWLLSGSSVTPTGRRRRGVSGHILSWGAPFTEVVTSVLPALVRGDTVIVKPSLRGPLSPVAFALLATDAGLPDGVVNLVQGTGGDIGADLIGRRELSALQVRAGERTVAQAQRAHDRTGVPLRVVRGGGNVLVVGPGTDDDPDLDVGLLADAVAASVRIHNAGGPFGLPLLVLHADHAGQVLRAVSNRLADTVAAPLPTEPLRRRAVQRIETLLDRGATAVVGGPAVPDDVTHRMSWRVPPTVLLLGEPHSPAARLEQATVPLGPVLSVVTWTHPDQLAGLFTAPRAADGVAGHWGTDDALAARLPHGRVIARGDWPGPLFARTIAPTWTGGAG